MSRSLLVGLAIAGFAGMLWGDDRITPYAGEAVNGFPNWEERVLLELTNRARVAPQIEMTACGSPCAERACYSPMPPLQYSDPLTHAARFHADNMNRMNFFAHDSICTIVSNINSIYPSTCNGSAACACIGGAPGCSGGGCTSFSQRVALFGVSGGGEVIAGASDPDEAFYLWLYEPTSNTACDFTFENGHRFLLLTSSGAVGFGASGGNYVGDFGTATATEKIPSGSHYPQQGSTIEFWANWFDTAAPSAASVNINGVCSPMTLQRGTSTNGAYSATVSGLGTGCSRYYFTFVDSTGATITYPTTGSFGIGPAGSCADWNSTRSAVCAAPGRDVNGDGVLNVADIFYMINTLFAGGPAPVSSGDMNGDGQTNVADIFYLINHLFAGGPAPL